MTATPAQAPASAPTDEVRIACPECGAQDMVFDWNAVVSVAIKDGQVRHVTIGGVFGVRPDRLVCYECSAEVDLNAAVCNSALGEAVIARAEAQVPPAVRSGLHDGVTVWEKDPIPGARSIAATAP